MTPYQGFDPRAFWKSCRDAENFAADALYHPKFALRAGTKIATAGSCFAQNIGRYLDRTDADLLQVEPAPAGMSAASAGQYGYGLYSARYGNVYTSLQLLQLIEDAQDPVCRDQAIWEKDGRFYDAIRPGVEPRGLETRDYVRDMRLDHLKRVHQLFQDAEVFIFTLGLTEFWQHKQTGIAFPTCPGVIAGTFDADEYGFCNARYPQVKAELEAAFSLLRKVNPGLRILLTVSPVPLTATASDAHVLTATTYSKSVLRAVAGDLSCDADWIDYFPSYELITGSPFKSAFYSDNLRQVTEEGVQFVMSRFFAAQPGLNALLDLPEKSLVPKETQANKDDEDICEDILLQAFAK